MFGETLSWWTPTRTTTNWPPIILGLPSPFSRNERMPNNVSYLVLLRAWANFSDCGFSRRVFLFRQEFSFSQSYRFFPSFCQVLAEDRVTTPTIKKMYHGIIPYDIHLDLSKHVMHNISRFRLRAHTLKVEAAACLEDGSRVCDQCPGEDEHVQNKVRALLICQDQRVYELCKQEGKVFPQLTNSMAWQNKRACTSF